MQYEQGRDAYLLLEDGLSLKGKSIGKEGTSGGEICFNTGMTGYQEIYTDPSYYGQVMVNTTAHIGNYGAVDAEQESGEPKVRGIVVNEFSELYSRQTGDESLHDYMVRHNLVGITNIDTRKLVRHIRSKGAMNAIISSEIDDMDQLKEELDKIPSMEGLELATLVSTKESYFLGDEDSKIKVAVLDFGIKKSILSNLSDRGCYLKVFPAKTTFDELAEWGADGYFLSNGPGDPAAMDYAIETAKSLIDSGKPVFGICLGHQLVALAAGLNTFKMHHGHRGLNHPVKNLKSGKSEITSQNHGFSVDGENIEDFKNIELTHVNLNDKTVEGLKLKDKNVFSVQYHPESSPGPHDSRYLFDQFLNMLN